MGSVLMEFLMREASEQDLSKVMEMMQEVANDSEHKEWFMPSDEEFVKRHLQEEGFTILAESQEGKLAGFLNGISTDENIFRDEFFLDADLYNPNGENVMLLGLDVLPDHRNQGLAREIVKQYAEREKVKNRKRLILTCLQSKVDMYIKFGFVDRGISQSSWGGEEWHEMTLEI